MVISQGYGDGYYNADNMNVFVSGIKQVKKVLSDIRWREKELGIFTDYAVIKLK